MTFVQVLEHSLRTSTINEKNLACNVVDSEGNVAFRTSRQQAVTLTVTVNNSGKASLCFTLLRHAPLLGRLH